MITKRLGRDGKVLVTFAIPAAIWADTISVVGDFNNWDKLATPLRQTETGWIATVELEAGRAYEYRYLFDGAEWHNDWQADAYVSNHFGGDNSVVVTPEFAPPEPDYPEERVIPFNRGRLRQASTG
ncbi:MAG: isoamylase early set domain-containing protein [Chloroflexaceae bacterium]